MKKSLLFFYIILLLLCKVLSAQNNFEPVSKIVAAGTTDDVARLGNYLYVMNVGLVIFDFTTPSNPTLIRHLTPLERMAPSELIIDGNVGYAAWGWGSGGIMKMDFSDPENPSTVGNLHNPSFLYSRLLLSGSTLFAFAKGPTNTLSLHAMDINNGIILDSVDLFNDFQHYAYEAKRFITDGNYLYLTMGPRRIVDSTELHIFDISAPVNIAHISSISLGPSSGASVVLQGSHWDLDKRNNYLYIAAQFVEPQCHIKIVDVADPYSPRVIGMWDDTAISGFSGDIEVLGNNLLLSDVSGGFNVISVTDDTTLLLCNRIDGFVLPPPYNMTNFFMRHFGNHAFLFTVDYYAVHTIDISSPCSAVLIDTIPFAHDWHDVSAGDTNSVFAAVWNYFQFYTVDMSNVNAPFISQRTDAKGWGWGIDVKGNYAYLAMGMQNWPLPEESGGLFVYDISNPNTPQKLGWSPANSGNHDVQVFMDTTTNLAFVIAGQPNGEGESYENHLSVEPGLRIVDVSNPNDLVQLGTVNIAPQCRGIYKAGDYAYIAASNPDSSTVIDTSGLYIVDVSNLNNPFIVGKWTRAQLTRGEHSRAVFVKNNYAYLAHADGLVVLDVSDHARPDSVNGIALTGGQCTDVMGMDNFLFALTQDALFAFDISSPASPMKIDSISGMFVGFASHFDIEPPYIYVISNAGVFVFRFDSQSGISEEISGAFPSAFVLKQNYPNPFNPITTIRYDVKEIGLVSLKIFDILGREVATLTHEEHSAGVYSMTWDAAGMPSGIYLCRMEAEGFAQVRKLLLVK